MQKKISFSVLVILWPLMLCAQLDNAVFEDRYAIEDTKENKLYLGMNILGYVKNNEYTNEIADGYTLFGYQFHPYVSYYAAKNVRIDMGAFLKKDFGAGGYTEIAPTFTVKVSQGDFAFLFGNLEGGLSHRLIEPLYNFEKVITDRLENGIQALWVNDRLFADAWIDWETMIFKGDPFQEEISGGVSFYYDLINKDRLTLQVPFQTVLYHRGGQIDDSPLPLTSLMNNAFGMNVEWKFGESGFVKSVKSDNYYTYYLDFSNDHRQAFKDGNGWYFNITLKTKKFDVMGSYWRGNEFISVKGGALYSSVSSSFKNPGHIEEIRELFILRFLYDIKILDNLSLTARVEPLYDFRNRQFEFSHGFYVNYRPYFFLWKNKHKE